MAAGRLLQPKVEAEVALVLGSDLPPARCTVVDLLRATDFALPALEIVDSRVRDWDISIVDTVADNASCGMYVLGAFPVPLTGVNLRSVQMSMTRNGGRSPRGPAPTASAAPSTRPSGWPRPSPSGATRCGRVTSS